MSDTNKTPIQDSQSVQELLSILKDYGVNTGDLLSMLGNVGAMEQQLNTAVDQLNAVRQELNELREIQNHPIKNALQKTVSALEKGIADTRAKLDTVRENIVTGCKNAVSAFKEKGISALNNLADFFQIKEGLEGVRDNLDACIKDNNKTMEKIATFSAEYHETGLHVRNMGRALVGKETVEDVRPMGKLAKLAQYPTRIMRSCNARLKRDVEDAVGTLDKLEQAAKKPSVLDNLQDLKAQAAKTQAAPQARPKSKEVAI